MNHVVKATTKALHKEKYNFFHSRFIVYDADYQKNAIKRTWPEVKVHIYLYFFHVLKN